MSKPKRSSDRPSSTSLRASEGYVGDGRNMVDSTQIANLTEEYRRAIEREWSVLRVNEAEIQFKDVYLTLQAMASSPPPKKIGERRVELATLPARMQHAGIERQEIHTMPMEMELSQVFKEAQQLVLLGEPGSGKTTTLQFIGLCFVHEDWAISRLRLSETRIPIRVELRSYADILSQPGPSLEQALSLSVRELLRDINEVQAYNLIQHWRNEGHLLILLDALDEVPDRLRSTLREQIYRFTTARVNQCCRVVLTSRLAGYGSLGGPFKEFIIKPLEEAEEVQPYLRNWLAVLQPEWGGEKIEAEASRLHEQMIAQPALRRALNNPLFLRIAVQIYCKSGEVAHNRVDLYQHYIEDLWARAVTRGTDPNQEEKMWEAIELLAWQLQTDHKPNIAENMQTLVRDRMGLVVWVGERLAFSHTALQEYFVARRLARAWRENREGAWAFLRPRLHIATWREPVLLLFGGLRKEESKDLILRLMRAHSLYERQLCRDHLLVTSLLGESANIDQILIQKIVPALIRAPRNKNAQWAMFNGLNDLGVEDAWSVFGHDKSEIDLSEIGKGLFSRDRFFGWGYLVGERVVDVQTTAKKLEKIKTLEGVTGLLRVIKNHEAELIGRMAIGKLKEIESKEAVPALIQLLKNEDCWVRGAAVVALGDIREVGVIPALIQRLKDEDENVREAVSWELSAIISTLPVNIDKPTQKEQRGWLHKLLRSKYLDAEKSPIAERLAILEAIESRYQDPFQKVQPYHRVWKDIRTVLLLLAIVITLGLLTILGALFGAAQDMFKNLVGSAITAWFAAHSYWVIIALIVFGVMIGLLTWLVDRLKSTLRNKE